MKTVDGARELLDELRRRGLRVGLVTNQSGVARGLLTRAQVDAVNARVAGLLGPFDTVQVSEDGPDAPSRTRKPEPGMVLDAARVLGVLPAACVVVGDIGADVEAALSAGAPRRPRAHRRDPSRGGRGRPVVVRDLSEVPL